MSKLWPSTLVNDLAKRRVVIVIGAGVSKNSVSEYGDKRPPLWEEFLRAGLDHIGSQGTNHIRAALKAGDYLHACEWMKKKFDDDWENFLNEQFLSPSFKPSNLHDLILRLDQRVVLSMNIDNIYETFVSSLTGGKTFTKKYYDNDVYKFLRDGSDYIIKVHGTIESPASIIFTQFDYAKARTQYSEFYHVLDAAILSHTFLFIGCGVNDPDINLMLENQNFKFPQSKPHYLVTSSKISDDLEESLRTNRNIKCIKYDPKNNHSELVSIISLLIENVEKENSVSN